MTNFKGFALILLILSTFSCATIKPKEKFKKELKENQVSTETYLTLVKQAYIKGCIDGKNLISKEVTKGKRLEICRDFGDKYIISIRNFFNK